jgi:hypothetical protein
MKLQKKEDPFKEDIEKITKQLKDTELSLDSEFEQKEQLERIKENLPKLETEIYQLINSLIEDIQNYDAKQILDYFGALYSFSSSDTVVDDIDSDRNFKLDYLHSLITSIGKLNGKKCDEKTLKKIEDSIEKIKIQSIIYLMFSSEHNGMPNETKFLQTIHNMIVRGDSYSEHKIEMCRELFLKFDGFLKHKYNIVSSELIDELINIANYSIENEKQLKHNQVIDSLIEETTKQEVILPSYLNLEEITSSWKQNFQKPIDSIFKINKTLLAQEILDQLSMEIGENTNLKKGKIEYFPTNDTLIYDKPIVKIDNEYYCFNPVLIHYNLHTLLENVMLNIIAPDKHQKNYYSKKGEYLEDKSLDLFQDILPNCEIYKNLKYVDVDDKSYEVDGIVIYDNQIFIIEAKSNKFTLGARKGDINRIKRNTQDIVEKAYQQAIRAKKYILSNQLTKFIGKDKKVVLTIDREKINDIYLINTTLEPLNHISTNLSSLKQFGFIQDDEWIWSIYLNDLRIISEIIDSPSEFLIYIERRIKFNDYPQIKMAEEIDIFGYFLSEGLYFDDIEFPENGFMLNVDSSFSKDIDLYYHWKEGVLDEVQEKPTFFKGCENNIKFLIKKIEELKKENFSILTKFLINYDCYTQNLIVEQINLIKKKQRTDFHFYNEELNKGVVFVSKDIYTQDKLYEQCKLYAYERKINNWFVIIIGDNFIDFEQFYYGNKPNKDIEDKLEGLKNYRLQQTKNVYGKVGRNETCPCGSGEKYKKCCLNGKANKT